MSFVPPKPNGEPGAASVTAASSVANGLAVLCRACNGRPTGLELMIWLKNTPRVQPIGEKIERQAPIVGEALHVMGRHEMIAEVPVRIVEKLLRRDPVAGSAACALAPCEFPQATGDQPGSRSLRMGLRFEF